MVNSLLIRAGRATACATSMMALVKAFVAAGKPVFGICRGLQLINATFGGTLVQDIPTQRPALEHRNADRYDATSTLWNWYPIPGSASCWPTPADSGINSVHHQSHQGLASGFAIEARCRMMEPLRPFATPVMPGSLPVQWHPEFHGPEHGTLDDTPVLLDFLAAAKPPELRQPELKRNNTMPQLAIHNPANDT